MKKYLKMIVYIFGILFALVGIGGTVAFASGYIEWGGAGDYRNAMKNFDLIQERGQELKSERDLARASNQELQAAVEERDDHIHELSNALHIYEEARVAEVESIRNIVSEINSTNGKGNRHDVMMNYINQRAEILEIEDRISHKNNHNGESDQLKQAEEDMSSVLDRSEEVLDSLK